MSQIKNIKHQSVSNFSIFAFKKRNTLELTSLIVQKPVFMATQYTIKYQRWDISPDENGEDRVFFTS